MGTVLGAMRNVRWHELQHAYGSASQVPGVLSRIAWGDAPSSDEALNDLERWIGTPPVFDSTAATVPFLWELAATDTVRDRAGVLDLLSTILAAGNPEHPAWTRAAHDAVAEGRGTAVRLAAADTATSPHRTVRAAATRLLAAIDGHTCPACPAPPPDRA
ncbi:hypothetical protein ACIFUY_02670 [Streptomyces sp. CACIS-1.16CA]|uniref:hypothetical protein n=1 Tax=Streptomyces TaxID=1883 RepID=UPI000D51E8D2|nr:MULTISPECIES: hypothetical protein [Streptomyces]KAA6201915.1 hypothetical protein F2B00_12515 [Streptomyces parvus]PVC82948.1 hypothetical protein DBP20_21500 [Streptomyces sp. CS131]GGS14403.1 hypothetical protein GCM10010221_09070 [Streptomyces parvus]